MLNSIQPLYVYIHEYYVHSGAVITKTEFVTLLKYLCCIKLEKTEGTIKNEYWQHRASKVRDVDITTVKAEKMSNTDLTKNLE